MSATSVETYSQAFLDKHGFFQCEKCNCLFATKADLITHQTKVDCVVKTKEPQRVWHQSKWNPEEEYTFRDNVPFIVQQLEVTGRLFKDGYNYWLNGQKYVKRKRQ